MADKTSLYKSRDSLGSSQPDNSWRDFLKSASTVAASLVVPGVLRAEASDLLPTVSLGPHRVTRLIVAAIPCTDTRISIISTTSTCWSISRTNEW